MKMNHKLIMENWRQFVNERKTDEEYIQTARFLSDIFSDPNLSRVIQPKTYPEDKTGGWHPGGNPETDPNSFWDVFYAGEENMKHKAFKIVVASEYLEPLWEKYLDSSGGSPVIFPNKDEFNRWMLALQIFVAHHKYPGKNILGDMSDSGIMRIFLGDKVDEITDTDQLRAIVKEKAYSTFVHEGTHFFNAIRAGGNPHRDAKGGLKSRISHNPDGSITQEYADSTEELQARMIQIQNNFLKLGSWKENEDVEVYYNMLYSGNDGIRYFINAFISEYYPFANKISDWHRDKVVSRVYQFAQRLMKSEDYKAYVKYQAKYPGAIYHDWGPDPDAETVALQEWRRYVQER